VNILGVPLLGFIFICIFVCMGVYLAIKPQEYKNDLAQYEDVISRSPRWAIRVLGLFMIAFAAGLFYLISKSTK
jgi:hypothetical protein